MEFAQQLYHHKSKPMPIIVQVPPTKILPINKPRKKPFVRRKPCIPVILRIVSFNNQTIKKDPHPQFICQLPEMAYPNGWKGHHINRILPNIKLIVTRNPKPVKPMTTMSVSLAQDDHD